MKNEQKKQQADMIYESLTESWTYKRMTEEEKKKVYHLIEWIANCGTLKEMNTKRQVYSLISAAYHSFLEGIGYTGSNWRD